ncbi:MAG: hypothetical protein PWQ55_2085 [Chloroflexota bacterium]|nr:hypothetical protein [Chloroflexota bacterium]
MQSKNKAIRSGLILFAIGGLVLLAERLTDWGVSKLIGKLYCGARYMQAAGQVGDGTCGFNMDMVVGMVSFLLCLVGILFFIIGVIKWIAKRK